MRIANVMLGRGKGGLETMAVRYHDAFEAAGAEVLSIGRKRGWFAEQIKAPGRRGLAIGDLGAAVALGHALRRQAPDLVVAHGTKAYRLARSPLVFPRRRVAFVAHNFRFKPEMAEADLIIAASQPVAEAARERFPETPVELVENFGPLEFSPVREAPKGKVRIGALGRLHENKGFDVLVDAASILRAHGVDFELVIAGEGDERAALQRQIAAHGLEKVVSLPGWTDDPAAYLAGLDIFVLSSRVEPFGLVLVEAMAAGTPVVSTDIDGPGHILHGKAMGQLAPAEDAPALADAIGRVIADWPEAHARAQAAQAEARARFTMEAGAERLTNVLARAAPEAGASEAA